MGILLDALREHDNHPDPYERARRMELAQAQQIRTLREARTPAAQARAIRHAARKGRS